jgi:thiamine biosynthesis lipoprotein
MEQIEFKAMGCQMLAALDNHSSKTRQRLERVPEWFEEWEQCLSRFREDSELSNLNRSADAPRRVSKILWDVFQAARQAQRSSDGLVTPAVLDALVSAGYDRSFDTLITGPISPVLRTAGPVLPFSTIEEDDVNRSIQLPEGLRLDFGGVAKGWAADQAMKRLQVYGPALMDAGGDIAISGPKAEGQPWPVGVQDSLNSAEDLMVVGLNHGGIATSGRDYRRWNKDGITMHHIIDPRTSLPADTDVLSATVIAPNILEAETAAKVVLISGSQAGMAWLETHPPLAGLLVLEDGQKIYTNGFENYIWRVA